MSGRILVTGATGLIGRHILRSLLNSGAEVHACSRDARGECPGGATFHRVDLLDRDRLRALVAEAAPDIVVHCAWHTEHGKFWMAPANAEWVAQSVVLAQEAFAHGAQRFVGVGTGAEYEPNAPSPLSESASPAGPSTLYGSAKDTARRAIEALSAEQNRSFAWGRVFMLYGAGEHPARLVASLARALVRGDPAKMSSGRAVRDFMDARDVGAGMAALALSGVEGCVNVASGEPVSIRDVAETLARLSGRPELLSVGALPDRPNEPAASYADVSRLRNDVAFKPSISLEVGLTDALQYWREQAAAS